MPEFESQPLFEIARRLEIRGGHAWVAVICPPTDQNMALDQLQTELRSILLTSSRVVPLGGTKFEELTEALQEPNDDAVILSGGIGLTPEEWSSLDMMRSVLERTGPVILWLAPDDIANLTQFAPSIRSFIGAGIFVAGPDGGVMTESERQARLKELRQHYGMRDEEIVQRASSKALSPEPEFVEWLVLLGRGDLV